MTEYINIKYVNNTNNTDFEVMVFTKNYSTRTPKTYYVAWQVLRGQTSVLFKYPLNYMEVGASYEERGLLVVSGPFHADVGSSWKITQPQPNDTAILQQGTFINHSFLKENYKQIMFMYIVTGIVDNPDNAIVIENKPPSAWNGRKFDIGIYKEGKLILTHKDVHVGNQVDFMLQPRLFFAVVRNVTIGDVFTSLEIMTSMTEFDLSDYPHGMEVTLNEAPGGGQFKFSAVNTII